MDPHEREQSPSFDLPATQSPERIAQNVSEAQGIERTEKQSAIAVEQAVAQQAPQGAAQAVQFQPAAQATTQPTTDPAQGTALANTPQTADDTDLIEKEWVIKAKEIVARTAHDPHLQNKEMNKFKADYLKKRYNKAIKLSED